jgi:hypothetical protein
MQNPKFKKNRFCWICGNTVDLETCKVDEHGMPVHGDCYFLKVALASESMVPKPAHRIQPQSARLSARVASERTPS